MYLDSGCSKHMTRNLTQFSKLTSQDEGFVTFEDNNKGNIGNKSNLLIKNILLVDGLKHNLLSISRLCDKGYDIKFEYNAYIIEISHKNISLIALRINNMYTIDLDEFCDETYFSILNDDTLF